MLGTGRLLTGGRWELPGPTLRELALLRLLGVLALPELALRRSALGPLVLPVRGRELSLGTLTLGTLTLGALTLRRPLGALARRELTRSSLGSPRAGAALVCRSVLGGAVVGGRLRSAA